ncbi:MAG: ABC transporter substrate-binding protein [Firmicutes bacterium]|nr:ABC transporter substrate-binding protein [Bacillota bacterium]
MKKKFALLAALLLALSSLFAFTACGSSSDTEATAEGELDHLTVQSLWLPQGQFAGLYTAQAKGFYEEEGIDIEILPGGTDVTAEDQVENGVAQIGTDFYSSVLTYQEAGSDFINVFQTFNKSPQYLVAKKSAGINSPADFKGKKVANWFGGRQYELLGLANLNGLDPDKDFELVQEDYTMDQFINDEVDVASAMSYNEYILLLNDAGFSEDDLVVFDPNENGSAMLEDSFFVKREWAEENKDLLERFIRATIKGWAYAYENPDEAGQIAFDAGDGSSTLEHQIAMTKAAAELAVPDGDTSRIGELNTEKLQQTIDLGVKTGLIKEAISLDTSVDASYWEEATK